MFFLKITIVQIKNKMKAKKKNQKMLIWIIKIIKMMKTIIRIHLRDRKEKRIKKPSSKQRLNLRTYCSKSGSLPLELPP